MTCQIDVLRWIRVLRSPAAPSYRPLMGGDYSQVRFQPGKHFAAVLLQQGRVQTDSDWNEAESIRDYRHRMLVRDLLGPSAFVGGGFAVSTHGERLTIGAGHAGIDGLLCELATDTDLEAPPEPGLSVVYLDVWQREVSVAEDESLLEPALGGPDTSLRLVTVAHVRLQRVPGELPRRRPDWSVPTERPTRPWPSVADTRGPRTVCTGSRSMMVAGPTARRSSGRETTVRQRLRWDR